MNVTYTVEYQAKNIDTLDTIHSISDLDASLRSAIQCTLKGRAILHSIGFCEALPDKTLRMRYSYFAIGGIVLHWEKAYVCFEF